MAAQVIALALRVVIAAVFIYAGAVKIWDFRGGGSATQAFFQDVMNYQLTPWDVSMVVAIYLPWLEVIAGAALLGRRWRLGALTVTGAMTLMFLGALGSAWWRGLDISCGCFGREVNQTDFPVVIGRDVVLLAAIGFALWAEWRRLSSQTGATAGAKLAPA
jgi:putative oxidoreductase